MNAFALKLIALIAMIIDHVGDVCFDYGRTYLVMRTIGRLAFPIYCFLLVEGYHHTKNVMKYLWRLGFFACLSEVPFDLCFEGMLIDLKHQNVFITLFLGLLMLVLLESIYSLPMKLVVIAVFGSLAQQIHSDYRYIGILMILFFEYYREIPLLRDFTEILCNINFSAALQDAGIFALVPIRFYNGKKGPSLKYFFYAAYPVHLMIIYFVAKNIGRYG